MPFVKRALILAIFPLLARSLSAQDTPEEILKSSVVAIRNDECLGTGMVLDETGLILTNAHVVCSPLPYRVHVLATVQGSLKELVFRKVALVGFHPTYDLALIRIDPAEQDARLKPVVIAPDPPAPRERIFAMGFPGDHDRGKSKVLTWGEVRSTNREIGGGRFYDLDISVFHGNSGGPVSNGKGQVLGVVTILVEDGALAIPISEMKPARFGPLKNRTPDRTICAHFIDKAEKMLQGATDARARAEAAKLYQEALMWDTGNASLYLKVGQFHLAERLYPVAAAYFVRSLELQPWPGTPEVYLELASAFAGMNRGEDARAARIEALRKFPLQNSKLWAEMGATLEKDQRPFEAASCARIAIRTAGDGETDGKTLYQRLQPTLSSADLSKLGDFEGRIDDHLGRLRAEADRSRRDGKAFMTEEAEKALSDFEGIQKETRAPEARTAEVRRPAERTDAQTPTYSDAELNARFVRGRVIVAKEHVRSGRKEKAIEILEDILQTYPAEPESDAARLLLNLLRKS